MYCHLVSIAFAGASFHNRCFPARGRANVEAPPCARTEMPLRLHMKLELLGDAGSTEAAANSSTIDSAMHGPLCVRAHSSKVYVGSIFLWGHANPAICPDFDVHISSI